MRLGLLSTSVCPLFHQVFPEALHEGLTQTVFRVMKEHVTQCNSIRGRDKITPVTVLLHWLRKQFGIDFKVLLLNF